MDEHRIKSALEIAMEKAAGMPDLTPDELARRKEEECKPIGEAIARKYLEKALRGADLPIEVGKHRGDEAQPVRRAMVSSLCEAIDPTDPARSRRAVEGVQALAGASSRFEEARVELEAVLSEFEQQTQQRSRAFETAEKEKLRTLGISGSAIRVNVKDSEGWRQEQNEIRQAYDPRLDKLRKSLTELAKTHR